MIEAWLAGLEASAAATALRNSILAYPLVNAGHVFGIALVVGAMVPLDLRLAGMWPQTPLAPLWRVLSRLAVAGFGLAAVTGVLLFMTRATEYAESRLFLLKLAIIALALVNFWSLHRALPGPGSAEWQTGPPRPAIRAIAVTSLALWMAVLVLGRLVGYF